MDLGAVITFERCQALRKAHGLLTTLARVKLVSGQLNRTFPRPTPSSSIFCLRLFFFFIETFYFDALMFLQVYKKHFYCYMRITILCCSKI